MRTITEIEARAAGYRALTSEYRVPDEQWMLDRVLADMRRGNISHALVKEPGGFSVWRKGRPASVNGRGQQVAVVRRL